MRLSKKLLLGFCICFGFIEAAAQYHFDNWATDDGLPQNSVLSIVQTGDGYLWFTTIDGLVRFDGVRFTVFDKSNTKAINSNRFVYLFEDRQKTLWADSEHGGLIRYQNGEFNVFAAPEALAGEAARLIREDDNGELRFSTFKGSFRLRGNGKIEPDEESDSMTYRGENGVRWTFDKNGLRESKNNQSIKYTFYVQNYSLANLIVDRTNGLWAAAGDEFYQMKDGAITRFTPDGGRVSVTEVRIENLNPAIYQDYAGSIWTGGKAGLTIYNPNDNHWQRFDNAEGFFGNKIHVIYEDREGNVWLGSGNRGIFRASRKFISTVSVADGLSYENIYPIFEDSANQVWIGAHGISKIKNGSITNHDDAKKFGLVDPQSIYEDREGRVWVGFLSGVGYFKNNVFTNASEIVNRQTCSVMREDRAGGFWFGTEAGLFRLKNGEKTIFNVAGGNLPSDEIKDIYEDANGVLWIATYGGLVKLDGETGRKGDGERNIKNETNSQGNSPSPFLPVSLSFFTEADGLVSNRVRTITGEADGTLWLGTYDGGLSRFKDGKFTNYTTADGLFNNGVFRILEDSRGNFWMSSNRGIYRVAKQQLNDFADGKIARITSIAYGKQDGMLNTECNGGRQPAGVKTRDGKLWFPTQQGVVVIDPEAVPFNREPPPVVIESVKIDTQIASEFQSAIRNSQSAIEIKPGQTSLEIVYTGLSLIKSEQVRFKYRLENLETDWTEAGTRRSAYYSYLPPGDYTFRVIAANSDGVWNETGASFRLTVSPPFWRTWQFVGLAAFSLIGLVWLIYRRRVAQLQKEKQAQQDLSRRLIESQEQERKRIAGELHDSLSQNLVIIKNRAMISLTERENVEYIFEQIEEIAEAAGESLAEVREIASNLRPFQIDRLGLAKAIEALVRKATTPNLKVTARIDKIDRLLAPEMEINLYRIVQESLNNIIKHSGANAASVSIEQNEKNIEVEIRDNGKGFDVNAAPKGESAGGFGLIGINERARILGSTPVIESGAETGTTIRLHISI